MRPSSASGSGGTRVDWNDLYGYDNYTQGFNCGSPYSWSTAARNETNFRNFDSSTPIFIPEFQGGSFDNWGDPSYESCRTLVTLSSNGFSILCARFHYTGCIGLKWWELDNVFIGSHLCVSEHQWRLGRGHRD